MCRRIAGDHNRTAPSGFVRRGDHSPGPGGQSGGNKVSPFKKPSHRGNSQQLGLPLDPMKSKDLRLSDRFLIFHYKNPQVYDVLVRLARQAVDRGKKRIGMGMLWEIMRWEMWLEVVDDGEEFKLNNSYRSRYARMIMKAEPDLADVFETRKLKSS